MPYEMAYISNKNTLDIEFDNNIEVFATRNG